MPTSDDKLNERPEVENLLGIYSSLSNQNLKSTINDFSGKNFSDLKIKLTELIIEKISPISSEIKKIKKDTSFLDEIISKGSSSANEIASKKMTELKKIMGF